PCSERDDRLLTVEHSRRTANLDIHADIEGLLGGVARAIISAQTKLHLMRRVSQRVRNADHCGQSDEARAVWPNPRPACSLEVELAGDRLGEISDHELRRKLERRSV